MIKILCVDDDPYLTDLLRYGFAREGFEVVSAATGREGLRLVRAAPVDLVILDVNMPDMNGFKVLAALRTFSTIPVIMLTARHQDEDVVAGFGGGADDYVAKPFSMQVLATRVKAVLRRASARTEPVEQGDGRLYRVADALLDTDTNELAAPDGTRVRLTPTESRILQLLISHGGQVLSAERIMERIWDHQRESDVNVIKTHVRHLREKIARLPGAPEPIRTLPGVGYMVKPSQNDDGGERDLPGLRDLA